MSVNDRVILSFREGFFFHETVNFMKIKPSGKFPIYSMCIVHFSVECSMSFKFYHMTSRLGVTKQIS